jgi:NAD(P)-dependent dehydrogenase (short-subunit alcohol dehydrogenase family)
MTSYLIISSSTIGQAIAESLVTAGHVVIIAARNRPRCAHTIYLELDLEQAETYTKLAHAVIDHQVDVVIGCLGLLHDAEHKPEKTISQLNATWFMHNMQVNCLFHALFLSALNQHLPRSSTLKYIAFSARAGSISDNVMGGWVSYRASKAALNMVIKTVALEWRLRFAAACVITYHPGSVKTPLSAPFASASQHAISPEHAANDLLALIPGLTPSMSGLFYDYNQEVIPF